MSNYLSNLIAKTTETTSVVQPRPLSLYEPVAGVPYVPTPDEGQEKADDNVVAQPPALPWPAVSAKFTTTPATPSQAPAIETRSSPLPPLANSPALPRVAQPSEPPALPAAASAPQPATHPKPAIRPAQRRPQAVSPDRLPAQREIATEQLAVKPAIQKVLVERLGPKETVISQPDTKSGPTSDGKLVVRPSLQQIVSPGTAVIEPVAQPEDRSEEKADGQIPITGRTTWLHPPIRPDRPRVEKKGTAPAAVTPKQGRPLEKESRPPVPLIRPATAAIMPVLPRIPPLGKRRSAETAPTPTVQVTIGRIEVRATLPPPAPKKQRPKSPPVMSLDEYLRQRAGGDRR